MLKKAVYAAACAGFLLCGAGLASAHEVRTYEISGIPYEFVVGSLGEPVIVDDKTGVDFELLREGEPVIGAQSSLQVEMSAAGQKKTVQLSPVYGADGRYKSPFIATVATTLSYRIFGQLEGTPVDLTFTCNPAGHPQSEAETERMMISPDVIQTGKSGAFGCPQTKEGFGFPEAVSADLALEARIKAIEDAQAAVPEQSIDSIDKVLMPISAFLTLGLLVIALMLFRREKRAASNIPSNTPQK